jgi:hypothetical protein
LTSAAGSAGTAATTVGVLYTCNIGETMKTVIVTGSIIVAVVVALVFASRSKDPAPGERQQPSTVQAVTRPAPTCRPVQASQPAAAQDLVHAGKRASVGGAVAGVDMGDDLRLNLGREAFEREAQELKNPPESVSLLARPVAGDKLQYRSFVRACDEQGNPHNDERGITANTGTLKREVAQVDSATGTYVIREDVEGIVLKARSHGRSDVQSLPPIFAKQFTYARNGQLLKAEYQGHDITEQFQIAPQLVMPDGPVRVGDQWTSGGKPGMSWRIDARVDGFAKVLGRDCVVIHMEETSTVPPGLPVTSIRKSGKRFLDLGNLQMVREEMIETAKGDFGAEGTTKTVMVVRELTPSAPAAVAG